MRTSEEIYHRVRWDSRFDPARFVFGVEQRAAQISKNRFNIGFIVLVDRRVVGEPENIRIFTGDFCVSRKGKFFCRESGGN